MNKLLLFTLLVSILLVSSAITLDVLSSGELISTVGHKEVTKDGISLNSQQVYSCYWIPNSKFKHCEVVIEVENNNFAKEDISNFKSGLTFTSLDKYTPKISLSQQYEVITEMVPNMSYSTEEVCLKYPTEGNVTVKKGYRVLDIIDPDTGDKILCNYNSICDNGEYDNYCSDCNHEVQCNLDRVCDEGETIKTCSDCNSFCDDNLICDKERGETLDNCRDCEPTCNYNHACDPEEDSTCDDCKMNYEVRCEKVIKQESINVPVQKRKWVSYLPIDAVAKINTDKPFAIIAEFDMPKYSKEQFNFSLSASLGKDAKSFELDPDISACGDIVSPGNYILTANLPATTNCISINSSDVVLNCDGYSISGTNRSNTYGIYSSQTLTNVTIANCSIIDFANGFRLYAINDSVVDNIYVYTSNITLQGVGFTVNMNVAGTNYINITNIYAEMQNSSAGSVGGVFINNGYSYNNLTGTNITGKVRTGYGVEIGSYGIFRNITGISDISYGIRMDGGTFYDSYGNSTTSTGIVGFITTNATLINSSAYSMKSSAITTASGNMSIINATAYSLLGYGMSDSNIGYMIVYGGNYTSNNSVGLYTGGQFCKIYNVTSISYSTYGLQIAGHNSTLDSFIAYTASGTSTQSALFINGKQNTILNGFMNSTFNNIGAGSPGRFAGYNNSIINNSFYGNASSCMYPLSSFDYFINNTIYCTNTYAMYNSGTNCTFIQNDFHGNAYGLYEAASQNIYLHNYFNGTYNNVGGSGIGVFTNGVTNELFINNTVWGNSTGCNYRMSNSIIINETCLGYANGIYGSGASFANLTFIGVQANPGITIGSGLSILPVYAPNVFFNNSFINGATLISNTTHSRFVNTIFNGTTNLQNVTTFDRSYNISFTNCTFNSLPTISNYASNYTMTEYVRINVTNSSGAVYNANITLNNSANLFEMSELSGTDGKTPWFESTYYFRNYTAFTYYTNYTLLANASSNRDATGIWNTSIESEFWLNMTVGLDMCQHKINDNYVLTENYFCNSTGVTISQNDIILDCNGYTLTGANLSGSAGIFATTVSNITIKNCTIKDFISGISWTGVSSSLIENNSIYSMNETGSVAGIIFNAGSCLDDRLFNNYAQVYNSSYAAFYIAGGEKNLTIINNTAIGMSGQAFALTIVNSTVSNCIGNGRYGTSFTIGGSYTSYDNLYLNTTGTYALNIGASARNITISNSTMLSVTGSTTLVSGSNNTFINNTFYTSGNYGIYTTGSQNIYIQNNFTGLSGIYVVAPGGVCKYYNNTFYSASNIAFDSAGVNDEIDTNLFYTKSSLATVYSARFSGTGNNVLNNIFNGTMSNVGGAGGVTITGSNNLISNNTGYGNATGINAATGQNNTFINNTGISINQGGISIASANNTLDNNIGWAQTSNANYGIAVSGAQNIIRNNYANGTYLNNGVGRGFAASGNLNLIINNTGYTNSSSSAFDLRGNGWISFNNTGISRIVSGFQIYGSSNFSSFNDLGVSYPGSSGGGLNLQLSTNGIINYSNFSSAQRAILLQTSNNTIIVNSVLYGATNRIVISAGSPASNITFINSSFDGGTMLIADNSSNITIAEYVRINVTNSSGAMYNANVTFSDSFNTFKSSQLTLTNGFTPWVQVTTYFKNYTATINYINYTILGSAVGHTSKTASINFTQDKQYNLNLSLAVPPSVPILLNANSSNFTAEVNNLNWTNSTSSNPITYVIQIANISDFSSASLYYVNDIVPEGSNVTSINVTFTAAGDYYWRVLATDSTLNSSWSPVRQFNVVLDAQGPSVNWNYPENNLPLAPSIDPIEMDFNYSVFDNSTMSSCEFYLAGIMKNRVTTPLNGTSYNVSVSFVPANIEWFVRCNDSYNNVGTSEIRYFVLSTPSGGGAGGGGAGGEVITPQAVAEKVEEVITPIKELVATKKILTNTTFLFIVLILSAILIYLSYNNLTKKFNWYFEAGVSLLILPFSSFILDKFSLGYFELVLLVIGVFYLIRSIRTAKYILLTIPFLIYIYVLKPQLYGIFDLSIAVFLVSIVLATYFFLKKNYYGLFLPVGMWLYLFRREMFDNAVISMTSGNVLLKLLLLLGVILSIYYASKKRYYYLAFPAAIFVYLFKREWFDQALVQYNTNTIFFLLLGLGIVFIFVYILNRKKFANLVAGGLIVIYAIYLNTINPSLARIVEINPVLTALIGIFTVYLVTQYFTKKSSEVGN